MALIDTPNLQVFKAYVGDFDPENDDILALSMEAAKQWYQNAGVPDYACKGAQWSLAVYVLAAYAYEHRGALGSAGAEIPPAVFSHLHQLRTTPAPQGEGVSL